MNSDISRLTLSAVIPVYSGAEYLGKLVRELDAIRGGWEEENAPIALTEAIFVLDDPIDRSAEVLEKLAAEYPWISMVQLSRNFGQHPATAAGILHTSGDWVITLDEDLQHHPSRIEIMLARGVTNGMDIVYASPEQAVHESIIRDAGSRFYKKLMRYLSDNENIQIFNSFRLIRGSVARAASSVCGHETYFDIALSWFSQRAGTVAVTLKDDRAIRSGKSGYNIHKLLSHARRMFVSTHAKVLRFIALLGSMAMISGIAYAGWLLIAELIFKIDSGARGWSSLMVAIIFFGGLSVMMIGLLLEYISVILLQIQGKPTFFIVDRRSDALLVEWFKNRGKC